MGRLHFPGRFATGENILAAQVMGADLAYIGSAFIATEEANAHRDYEQMIVNSSAEGVVYTNLFTGVHGNYLKPSIVRAGLDPDNLPVSNPSAMNFGERREGSNVKPWRDIWGSGQGIGAVAEVVPAGALISRLRDEYREAAGRMARLSATASFAVDELSHSRAAAAI